MAKKLTEKQEAFLSALAGEAKGNMRQAMKMAGYADNTRVDEVYKALVDEIIEVAKQLLAANSIKAAVSLSDALDNPGRLGTNNMISAAKEVLDRAGIIKKEMQQQEIKVDNLYILPPKDTPNA